MYLLQDLMNLLSVLNKFLKICTYICEYMSTSGYDEQAFGIDFD